MFIIVGLGNYGSKYANTRHNAGFLALDILAQKHGIKIGKYAFKSTIGEGFIGSKKVVLAKPETYMNLSGQAVVELINWYKISPEDELIIIYDDVDLDVGSIRLRAKGSAGTHNGMKSIVFLTGNDVFPRVRVGIGKCAKGFDLADYVLSTFSQEEKEAVHNSLKETAEAVEKIICEGMDSAQQQFNKKPKKPKEKKPEEDKENQEQEKIQE